MRVNSDRVAARVSELLDGAYASSGSGVGGSRIHGVTTAEDHLTDDDVPADEDDFVEEDVDEELTDDDAALRAAADRAPPQLRARIAARVPLRLDPGRRSAAAVGIAVLVVAAVVGVWLYLSGPRSMAVPTQNSSIPGAASPVGTEAAGSGAPGLPSSAGAPEAPGASGAPGTSTLSDVVVDVAGKVTRPGLYHLSSGARIADAISAAGGARPGVDLTNINLAARVTDGQQILVGVPGAAGAPAPAATGGSDAGGGSGTGGSGGGGPGGTVVNLNSATLEQLETLPGIGPALGQRILDYRTEHGPFTSVDQLNDVSGIGDAKFAAVKAQVTV